MTTFRSRATLGVMGVPGALGRRVVVAFLLGGLLPLPLLGADVGPAPLPVVDLHVDLSYQHVYEGQPFDVATGQYRASDLLAAGVSGVVLPMYVPRDASPRGPRLADLAHSHSTLARRLRTTPPYGASGCRPEPGRVMTWYALEGAAPLARDLDAIWEWSRKGVKVFGLVHTYDNEAATSSGGATGPRPHGLTPAGKELVRRIHAVGGVVDVSHASDEATADVVLAGLLAGVPVIATHSNARAVAAHPRNLTDAQLRSIAQTGGVVGVNFHSRFLTGGRTSTLDDVVRHIRHIAAIAGIDHVAIGSDFEGDITPPAGLESARDFPALERALLASGLRRQDVAKVFAGNALRVLCPTEPAR